MDETVNMVAGSKARDDTGPMLMQSCKETRTHADIQRAVPATGEDVDARLPFDHQAWRQWMLTFVSMTY
jgi:hypothetical protein